MRAACPTPVSVVEEDIPAPRSVGGYQTPVYYTRARVTKGFTCRRPVLCEPEGRETPLSPTTNLRGRSIFRGRPHSELVGLGATPGTPVPSPRHEETAMTMSRDFEVQSVLDGEASTESEGEEDERLYNLSVTGRNPVLSESNVVDWHQPPPIRLPTKALSAEHQSVSPMKTGAPRSRCRKLIVPVKSLNIGGLGLPFPSEPQRAFCKDYKPGRIVNSSFDCFRCENRMSAHDAHEWFESILVSSRVRGAKRGEKVKDKVKGKDRKYSKDEISRALFPRYWSKQCLSPDPRPRSQMKTPDTRPPTQTPDTISGPWRAGCSRADSRDGMIFGQMTREDLQGFCGSHGKSKCPSGIAHESQLAPCRPYYSDTQLGVNFMTGGDLWCHNADARFEAFPGTRVDVESHVTESVSRNTISRLSQNGKTSRLSVHSRDGYPTGRASAFEFRMRIHCDNPEDVFYELHEEDEDEDHQNDDVGGVAAVRMDYSITPTRMRGHCQSCCHGPHYGRKHHQEVEGDEEEDECPDHGSRCCSMTNTTPSCCYSRSSTIANDHNDECNPRHQCSRTRCCSIAESKPTCCHSRPSTAIATCNNERPPTKYRSQIDCNTSAVDRSPSLEIKGKKASTGLAVKDIKRDRHQECLQQNERVNETLISRGKTQLREPEIDENLAENGTNLDNDIENFQDENLEDEEEAEADEHGLLEEQDSYFYQRLCENATKNSQNNQTYPDLPKPLGRYFCYVPIVDKRYNRWRRRKPKKRKRAAAKVRQNGGKTPSSTSDESTTGMDGRESKRSKPCRKNGTRSRARKSRQSSRIVDREKELLEESIGLQFDPVFDQSDWAEDTQFPDSTEACTDSSKSSLASTGTGASTEPNTRESFTSPSPVTFVDISDLCQTTINVPAVSNLPRTPEIESNPELVLEQTRTRSRVASIPSKNCPRTQKSLLSLSLRGPSIEKEMSTIDPMQALPRAGGRLPLLKTQRSVLARSSDSAMGRIPSNVSYLSRMERRLGWIKRGIMQKNSNQAMVPLPKMELKLAAEKYTMTPSPKSPVPKTRMTKGTTKNRSAIPRSKAATAEKFSSVIRGQKKQGSSKKRQDARKSSRHDMMSVYLADEEDEDEDYPTFTLKDLLSSLPDNSDSKCSGKRQYDKRTIPPHKLTSLFNNFVTGSPLHKRNLQRHQMERSISALSFTPAFTFSVYTLPEVYRSHNITLDKAAH